MNIKKLSKREHVVLSAAAVLLTAWVIYGLIVEPFAGKWKRMDSAVKAKTISIIKSSDILARYEEAEKKYPAHPALLAEKSGTEEEEVAGILGEVESISKNSACNILNIKPRQSKKIGDYKELSCDISAEGDMNTFTRFIYGVENSAGLLKVKSFSITSKSASSGVLKATFIISKVILS